MLEAEHRGSMYQKGVLFPCRNSFSSSLLVSGECFRIKKLGYSMQTARTDAD